MSEVGLPFKRLISIALVALVGLLAGCSNGSGESARGTVVGVASPCQGGPIPPATKAAIEVRVSILQGSRVLAVQVVQGQHRYRFSVPPGNYVVKSDQGMRTPAKVMVTAGRNTTADLPSGCI
jgi:hypothetical protein